MFSVLVPVQADFISFSLFIKAKFSLTFMQISSQEASNVSHPKKVYEKTSTTGLPMAPYDRFFWLSWEKTES